MEPGWDPGMTASQARVLYGDGPASEQDGLTFIQVGRDIHCQWCSGNSERKQMVG